MGYQVIPGAGYDNDPADEMQAVGNPLAMVARYSHEMTDDLASKLEQMLEAHE